MIVGPKYGLMKSASGLLCQYRGGALRTGAFNIVPERVVLSLEFRAAEIEPFQQLKAAILRQARRDAPRFALDLEIEPLGKRDPVILSPAVQAAAQAAAGELGLRTMPVASRAGHDAQPMAAICPAGMIFVPSSGGTSHSPDEFTPWQDCVNGANVLLQAALRLSGRLISAADLAAAS